MLLFTFSLNNSHYNQLREVITESSKACREISHNKSMRIKRQQLRRFGDCNILLYWNLIMKNDNIQLKSSNNLNRFRFKMMED